MKIHYKKNARDHWLGESTMTPLCRTIRTTTHKGGIAVMATGNPSRVTCKRCQKIMEETE